MGNVNRKYTEEFKKEAVHLALKSPAISQAAESLGIPAGTLYSWVEQIKKKDGMPNIVNQKNDAQLDVSKLIEENRRLHKELAIAKEEKEILKKAAAYFAQHQK
jgi:transposase